MVVCRENEYRSVSSSNVLWGNSLKSHVKKKQQGSFRYLHRPTGKILVAFHEMNVLVLGLQVNNLHKAPSLNLQTPLSRLSGVAQYRHLSRLLLTGHFHFSFTDCKESDRNQPLSAWYHGRRSSRLLILGASSSQTV
jgi:hypothetical protein